MPSHARRSPFPGNKTTARYSGTTIRVNVEYTDGGYTYKVEEAQVRHALIDHHVLID